MLNTDGVDPDRVEKLIDEFFAENGAPGLAYGVVAGGELVHSGGRGHRVVTADAGPDSLPDADTVFRIASMTKSFTATAVLALRDEGLLSLDDPVAAHLPEASGMGLPTADSAPITVRQLLTMSSGLPTDDPWGDRQQALPQSDFEELLAGGLRFAWPNGAAFEYSNLGYALLGRLIAAVAGQEYRTVMAERVLRPLGLDSTGYDAHEVPDDRLARGYRSVDGEWAQEPLDDYGAFSPMGGLFSTVRDLSRWVGGFTDAFPARDDPEPTVRQGGHPLRRASRRELQQPHRGTGPVVQWTSLDAPPRVRAVSYGFGLFVEQDPRLGDFVGHSGGYPGFGSHMRWHPDSGVGVIVLANSTYAHAPRVGGQLLLRLLDDLPGIAAARARSASGTSAPRSAGLWPETVAAQADVERLVSAWDDDLADRLFAMNVDLDDALTRRKVHLAQLCATLGPFTRDRTGEVTSDSPAHLVWWMRGPAGRLRLEIRLSPQLPPRVQTFSVTGVPQAPAALLAIAQAVVGMFAADFPRWPDAVAIGGGLDPAGLTRLVRVASGWAGPSRVVETLAGDGRQEATFRLDGARAPLLLVLAMDAAGAVTRFGLRPAVAQFGLRPAVAQFGLRPAVAQFGLRPGEAG